MKKKPLFFILFSAVLFLLVYLVQTGIDRSYNKNVSNKFTRLFNHKIDANVMIFGSSVAYVHFDPSIIKNVTGLSAYNMGWDGTFFVQYNCLIKEYLSYEKQCKYLIIAADIDNLGKNELITRPDLYYSHLSNSYVYNSLHEIEPDKIWKAKYIPGYKLTLLNKAFYNDLFIGSRIHKTDTSNGYEPQNLKWDKTGTAKPFNARYEERIYTQLQETINTAVKKGIKVIIVFPPMYEEGYRLVLNMDWLKEKYKVLTNKNVYMIDYTTDTMCKNRSYFYNYGHLNTGGASIFSTKIGNDINNIIATGHN